ncbi:hypothetical protein V6N13_031075 [Hibiscus sabdariffa]
MNNKKIEPNPPISPPSTAASHHRKLKRGGCRFLLYEPPEKAGFFVEGSSSTEVTIPPFSMLGFLFCPHHRPIIIIWKQKQKESFSFFEHYFPEDNKRKTGEENMPENANS